MFCHKTTPHLIRSLHRRAAIALALAPATAAGHALVQQYAAYAKAVTILLTAQQVILTTASTSKLKNLYTISYKSSKLVHLSSWYSNKLSNH